MSTYPSRAYQTMSVGSKVRRGFKSTYKRLKTSKAISSKTLSNLEKLAERFGIKWNAVLIDPVRQHGEDDEQTAFSVYVFGKDEAGYEYLFDKKVYKKIGQGKTYLHTAGITMTIKHALDEDKKTIIKKLRSKK
jgi:hypothetical protein